MEKQRHRSSKISIIKQLVSNEAPSTVYTLLSFPIHSPVVKKYQLSPSYKNITLGDFVKPVNTEYFYEGCLGQRDDGVR